MNFWREYWPVIAVCLVSLVMTLALMASPRLGQREPNNSQEAASQSHQAAVEPSATGTQRAADPSAHKGPAHGDQNDSGSLPDWISAFASIAAVLVSIWAVIVVRKTLVAALQANEGFKASAERQLRAYVHGKKFALSNFNPNSNARITWVLQNFGETPAYDLRYVTQVLYLHADHPERIQFDRKIARQPSVVVAPGGELFCTAEFIPDSQTHAAVRAGARILTYIGLISYRDTFGRRRRTIFQVFLKNGSGGGGQDYDLIADSRHNTAN